MAVSEDYYNKVVSYCKVEEEDEDIGDIIAAAIQKAEVETGKRFDESAPLYAMAIKMLCLDWYDHRGSVTTENLHELPMPIAVQSILNQIAMSNEFAEKEMSK